MEGFFRNRKLQKELGTCRALKYTQVERGLWECCGRSLACGVPVIAYKRGPVKSLSMVKQVTLLNLMIKKAY